MAQVTDYNIANASGASVRSDLNLVFDAIKTLNSGSSDPANMSAFMPYVDTADSNNLKIRNSSNNGFTTIGPVDTANLGLLPVSGGTMTGVLGLSQGVNSAPSINFGDSTTGLYKRGTNQIGLTFAGTERIFLDQNGVNLKGTKAVRFFDDDDSHYVEMKAGTVTTNRTITLPNETGTLLTSNSNLSQSQVISSSAPTTIGTTAIPIGSGSTTIAGLTSLTSTTLVATNLKATNYQDASGNTLFTATQIKQGRLKAWINYTNTGDPDVINDSFGVSSITQVSTGVTRVSFSTNFSNVNYCVAVTVRKDANGGSRGHGVTGTPAVGEMQIETMNAEGTSRENMANVYVMFSGDT